MKKNSLIGKPLTTINWFIVIQFIWIQPLYAKDIQEIATDMIEISQAVEGYFQTYQIWPNSFVDLENEDLLNDLNIEDEVKNRDYRIYQSDHQFGIGVSETLVQLDDLELYLPKTSNFAGYNWIFIEKTNEQNPITDEVVDYYDKLLPFVSNTKLIIQGEIFNPNN